MEKFYKVARIVAFVILAKLLLWNVLCYSLLDIRWQYNLLSVTIITTFIHVLLIWMFSILIHNSDKGSHVYNASILAVIGFGIWIAYNIYECMSIYEWFDLGYDINYSIAPLLQIIGFIIICIAILSITRLFHKKSLAFISGIIYFVCLLVYILSDIDLYFWVSGSYNYDSSSLGAHIYTAIRNIICIWLEQISLLLFVFGLSKISKKKQ